VEQFKNWIERHNKKNWSSEGYEWDVMEEAWRAALEWILTHKKPIKYNDYKFDYIKTDVIEEELNATSEKRC